MNADAKICYCFHVTRRKLFNYCRREHPQVPSQLSECGGAGTGCGWCIPFLKKIFQQECKGVVSDELSRLSTEEYAQRRAAYIRAGLGVPAPGAEPLPPAEGDE